MMKAVESSINLPKMEEDVLSFWEKEDIFQKSNEQRKDAPLFSFYDGPPFANGLPHYGHLLANTIKDTVPRYWIMRGYAVERRFGWDTHGVPVEYEIEKREKLSGRQDILELGVGKFNEMCRESVLHYADEWKKVITRLGRWVDWNHQYRTMDIDFMESVWWVFHRLYEKGLVYQGHKVVPYSPRITAVLSNFEANQNYQEVQDPAITVKFKLKDEDAHILAWTTTPWTLISNLALAVGPDIEYVKVKHKETAEVYYLAKARLEAIFKKSKKSKDLLVDVLESVPANKLAGLEYEPLFPYFADHANSFRVLSDDYVTTDDGTGVVHMAPAYGEDDFRVCSAAGIELIDPLDEEGRYKAQIKEYAGEFVKDADKNIIRDLKASGQLLKQDVLVHSYPMCDRTNSPLIYRAIPSWYVAVEGFRDQLVKNNQQINWVPDHLKNGRMGKWLENARDWAISRNRFWGTPIPIWVCDQNDEHIHCVGSVGELEKLTSTKVDDLHKHFIDDLGFSCTKCDGKMKRISEVFDCWFESGSMPYAQKHYPFENEKQFGESFPADFIAEGLDQTRGWFYTLAVLSQALFEKPAFKNVVVNGLVLADDGRKMSKRWRNFTPPVELIEELGADSVRLYMMNSAILRGEDLKFDNDGVKDTTRAVILPLWNAYSFLTTYAKADSWEPSAALASGAVPKVSNEMDRWLLSKLQTLLEGVNKEMEAYHLYNVVPRLVEFIGDLTNWYIRLSRRKFWSGEDKLSDETREAYETLYYALSTFCKAFAPFAPFTSERIYRGLTEGQGSKVAVSVHLCDFPMPNKELVDHKLEEKMTLIRTVTELGRSLRAKHQIKIRQVLPALQVITNDPTHREYLQSGEGLIKSELNLKSIEFTTKETDFVNLSVRPNLKLLGRKLGKQMKAFRDELDRMNQDPAVISKLLQDLEAQGTVKIMEIGLTKEDFLIDRSPKDDRLIATERAVTVLLDTKLTPELIAEGLAREVVNRVQNLRKDSGFEVTNRIQIAVSASQDLAAAVKAHAGYIRDETLADTLDVQAEGSSVSLQFTQSYEIGSENCVIGIQINK